MEQPTLDELESLAKLSRNTLTEDLLNWLDRALGAKHEEIYLTEEAFRLQKLAGEATILADLVKILSKADEDFDRAKRLNELGAAPVE